MKSRHVPGIEIVSMDPLIDFQTRVELARQLAPGDKMLLGLEMFDHACDEIRSKIESHFPGIPESAANQILGALIERSKRDKGPP